MCVDIRAITKCLRPRLIDLRFTTVALRLQAEIRQIPTGATMLWEVQLLFNLICPLCGANSVGSRHQPFHCPHSLRSLKTHTNLKHSYRIGPIDDALSDTTNPRYLCNKWTLLYQKRPNWSTPSDPINDLVLGTTTPQCALNLNHPYQIFKVFTAWCNIYPICRILDRCD